MQLAVILSSKPQSVGYESTKVRIRPGTWKFRCVDMGNYEYTIHTLEGDKVMNCGVLEDGAKLVGPTIVYLKLQKVDPDVEFHSVLLESI